MSLLEPHGVLYSMSTYRFGFFGDGSGNLLPARRGLELALDDYLRNADLHLEEPSDTTT